MESGMWGLSERMEKKLRSNKQLRSVGFEVKLDNLFINCKK